MASLWPFSSGLSFPSLIRFFSFNFWAVVFLPPADQTRKSKFKIFGKIPLTKFFSWCQDKNTGSRTNTEVKNIVSSADFQLDKTSWWVGSAVVEQSRRKANMVAQGNGKFGPWGWPQDPSKPKKPFTKLFSGWCQDENTGSSTNIKVKNILNPARFKLDKTIWWVGSAVVEQLRRKVGTVAQGHGRFDPEPDARISQTRKQNNIY